MKGIDALPNSCYTYSRYSQSGIIIRKGETGYYKAGSKMTEEDVIRKNNKLGVSKEAEQAMSIGSMCGWTVPAVTEFEEV